MPEANRYSRRNGSSGRADSIRYCLGGEVGADETDGVGRVTKGLGVPSLRPSAQRRTWQSGGRSSSSRAGYLDRTEKTRRRNNIAYPVVATFLCPCGLADL
jgi:hypothetical protein